MLACLVAEGLDMLAGLLPEMLVAPAALLQNICLIYCFHAHALSVIFLLNGFIVPPLIVTSLPNSFPTPFPACFVNNPRIEADIPCTLSVNPSHTQSHH
jgi:hypothetical protein